jgi:hypothetical protein
MNLIKIYFKFEVGKDGHTRIYNTVSQSLVKTLLSPSPKSPHETYSDIPSVLVMDKCQMLYAINNQIMSFSF